ncbi:MAG: LytTR family DNA-binding domain-containing protein [Alistipes sp.]|nr:LytTR family DNA-binding domain-containing protein [Alistipes sp.]
MIRIAVVDDEEIAVEKISKIIKSHLSKSNVKHQIDVYTDPIKFLSDFFKLKFQILFIDLDMPIQSGFEISDKIRKVNENIPIVYITNRNDLVYQAFKYKAVGFIRKNVMDKELPDILDQVLKEIESHLHEISIVSSGKLYQINIEDIIYVLSEDHNLLFHIRNQKDTLKMRGTLTSLTELISFSDFISISASCIVNYRYIFSIEKDCILLKNNENLYIPRRKVKEVKEDFLKLSRGNLI